MAEDLKTAVALAGSAVEAQDAINKSRKKIAVFERDRSSLSGDLQKTYDDMIGKQNRSIAGNQDAFDRSLSALRDLPQQVKVEALIIVREQLGNGDKAAAFDALEQEIKSAAN